MITAIEIYTSLVVAGILTCVLAACGFFILVAINSIINGLRK